MIRQRGGRRAARRDPPSSGDLRRYRQRILPDVAWMVENLLFLARSDSESPPLVEIIAVPTFQRARGRAEPLARGRGASFEANLSGEGYLMADPARLEQAVLILVDNAAKYSSDGKLVTLFATTESGELLIRVEDRGPGIRRAPAHLRALLPRRQGQDAQAGRCRAGPLYRPNHSSSSRRSYRS